MAFSYDAAALSSPLNKLRFLVQDTENTGHFLEDEEINAVFSDQSNMQRAAAQLCRVIAAKLGKMPNVENDAIKFDAQERAKEFRLLAAALDAEALRAENSLEDKPTSSNRKISLTNSCDDGGPAFTRKLHFG